MISAKEIQTALAYPLEETNFALPNKRIGKVRDSYSLPDSRRLFITTDRLSAFDKVLHSFPYKGQVLNQLSAWWFDQTTDIIANHKISLPDPNALLAIEVEPFPIEVIVRGYITGVTSTALWYRYSLGEREIYGYHFPEGLKKNQLLPEPLITPTTKGTGNAHDERLTCQEVTSKGYLDKTTWDYIQTAALALFKRGQKLAENAGLLLVDTKYEFGKTKDGKILLIDEVHTPDSSRFWRAENYFDRLAKQQEPENFDKEFIRLAYIEQGYRGEGPAPKLSDEIWIGASQRYIEIYERLTDQDFIPGTYPINPRLTQNLKSLGV